MRSLLAAVVGLGLVSGANAFDVSLDPAEIRPGGVVLVRTTAREPVATFRGKEIAFFPIEGGAAALLGVDLDAEPGTSDVDVRAHGEARHVPLRVVEHQFPEERLEVARKYTELDDETLARVLKEQKRLRAIWERDDTPRLWRGTFLRPADGADGSPFGLRRFFNGEPRSPHSGIDMRAPAGAPVRASNRGRVVLEDDFFFTGNSVVLDHGRGLYTIYIHLSERLVKEGKMVDKGEVIGKVGATGRVTGPHLHFAVRLGGARVDPRHLMHRNLEGVSIR